MHTSGQGFNLSGNVRHKHNPNTHGTAITMIIH